jgi:hypothetical protein
VVLQGYIKLIYWAKGHFNVDIGMIISILFSRHTIKEVEYAEQRERKDIVFEERLNLQFKGFGSER